MTRPLLTLAAAAALYWVGPRTTDALAGIAAGALAAMILCLIAKPNGSQ